tara:strand:- start:1649 stop:2917 length:1269 start_codon:yes stop_codon:yes gene_type:complete
MANKFGFASVNQQVNESNSKGADASELNELKQSVIYARVVDIILDDQHPEFDNNGGWSGIGTVFFSPIELSSTNVKTDKVATPLIPYIKNYPVVNEFVLLFKLPSNQVLEKTNITKYYYLNPISLWNNQHLNAFPNLELAPQIQQSEQKSYQAIEQGQTRKSSGEEINYNYNSPLVGGTFIERSNIHPLLAYAGDIIIEGRWGNSIRFGSTANIQSGTYNNDWSNTGEDGNPITIIRNGQPIDASEEGYLPIIENINEDLSSIYLTSNQTIPLQTTITSNPAIKDNPPQSISSYEGSQVMINSDRLVFNSKADSIILNSQKTISLSSVGSIGIFSQEGDVVLQASKNQIKLGDSNANQSIILGDKFMDDFKDLLNKLQILCQTLSVEPKLYLSGGTAGSAKTQISLMLNNLKDYTSKIVKAV